MNIMIFTIRLSHQETVIKRGCKLYLYAIRFRKVLFTWRLRHIVHLQISQIAYVASISKARWSMIMSAPPSSIAKVIAHPPHLTG